MKKKRNLNHLHWIFQHAQLICSEIKIVPTVLTACMFIIIVVNTYLETVHLIGFFMVMFLE